MKIGQLEMISVESLVAKDHPYRKLKRIIDFNFLTNSVKLEEKELGAAGYTVSRLTMCLILKFMENLSGRLFERFMVENVAGKC